MRVLLLLGLLGLAGCPKPIPPVVEVPPVGYDFCQVEPAVTNDDVCYGMFTKDGFSCVNCNQTMGCLSKELLVYCVNGSCLTDSACAYYTKYSNKHK